MDPTATTNQKEKTWDIVNAHDFSADLTATNNQEVGTGYRTASTNQKGKTWDTDNPLAARDVGPQNLSPMVRECRP